MKKLNWDSSDLGIILLAAFIFIAARIGSLLENFLPENQKADTIQDYDMEGEE